MERRDWVHLVVFKLGWFVAVVGGADWLMWQLLLVAVAFAVVRPSPQAIGLVLAVALIGIARDAALSISGLLEMRGGLMPLWLVLLWVQFALVLHRGMHWLAALAQPLQVGIGVVTGTLAYAAAVSLGAGTLGQALESVIVTWLVIAATWGLLLWVQLRVVNKLTKSGARA